MTRTNRLLKELIINLLVGTIAAINVHFNISKLCARSTEWSGTRNGQVTPHPHAKRFPSLSLPRPSSSGAREGLAAGRIALNAGTQTGDRVELVLQAGAPPPLRLLVRDRAVGAALLAAFVDTVVLERLAGKSV